MITGVFADYSDHPIFYSMIRPMKEKFNKYFEEISPVFYCVSALNSLCKQVGVNSLIDMIEDNMCAYNAGNKKNKINKIFVHFINNIMQYMGLIDNKHLL